MKTYQYLFGLALSTIFICSSCSKDFLTLYPEGNLNEGTFYKTEADFQQAVIGAYVPMRDIANNAFWMDEMRSDNATYDYFEKDRGSAARENISTFMDDATNGVTVIRYQANFTGIARTNAILDHIEGASISDSIENQVIGEAKALRGHYYFDLVKTFGGVPLQLHEILKLDDAYLPRATADEVYAQIINDLKDALNRLPAPKFTAAETGRINKGVVATELAAVYMQKKDYASAIPLLQSVAAMGYTLMPNFKDIFNPANKNANANKELIFDVQYQSGTTGQSSSFIYRFIPNTPNTTLFLGVNFNVNGFGGWDVPTDNLIALFETGDTRLDASVGVAEGNLNSSQDFIASKLVSAVGYVAPTGVKAKYFCKKFYYPPYPNLNQNTDQNWTLYRYADVLLMLAECLNETNKPGEALPYVNQIRTRAFGNNTRNITISDQAGLRNAIAQERRMELAFENKRWHDLIRTGQAITVMNAYGITAKAKFPYLLPQSFNVTENRLIYPIPQREMDLNKKLVQNPGY